jgi:hypothetical protein
LPAAVTLDAEVVDDDARAFLREEERVRPSDTAARARDDRDLVVEESHATMT